MTAPMEELPYEQCRIILDSIADGVFTVDLDWRITSFNRAAERITGIARQACVGRPCFEVFRADVCESGCVLRQTLATGAPIIDLPIHIYRADRKRIPVSVSTALLRDGRGEVIGGAETFRDLSALSSLRKALRREHTFDDIVSKNEKMREVLEILPQVAESRATVLIEGASGTGKELLARAIHNHSPVKDGPFVSVNCAALPDALIESELFGYKAGAFTDARRDKPGRFDRAQNGTIFLDEVGDISPAVQVRLLRVLQERVYEPLGSTRSVPSNARVIAATHRDLERLVREEKFREDLYFRIHVIKLSLPPLAGRREDIPLLVDLFLDRYGTEKGKRVSGVSPDAMAALMRYAWPGNVRELENSIEHALVFCRGPLIGVQDLPEHIPRQPADAALPTGLTLKAIERHAIIQALGRHEGRRVATARELGIDKNTLRRKLQRLGLRER